ncbi:MarC family protein [Nonlabens sp. YIK11]|uniref:MarC family protein n=1 Tax=Nonlabens sp. YIK11 TaxID=1453349 RepID=UPI00293429F3|nr:MarC family protein [Nonlabens sp. YIK11]
MNQIIFAGIMGDFVILDVWAFAISVFTGLFAITNPIANVPVFLGLTEGAGRVEKHRINKKATFTAFMIILLFTVLGKFIFDFFGITIPAFKITGGLLIFYAGFRMLQSKKSNLKTLEQVDVDENIAISPLAIPLIAGPGTIVTTMNFVTDASYLYIGIVIAIAALICWMNYLAFNYSTFIVEKIGNNVITVIGKIMGLIIAIIGTTMVVDGLKLAF